MGCAKKQKSLASLVVCMCEGLPLVFCYSNEYLNLNIFSSSKFHFCMLCPDSSADTDLAAGQTLQMLVALHSDQPKQ